MASKIDERGKQLYSSGWPDATHINNGVVVAAPVVLYFHPKTIQTKRIKRNYEKEKNLEIIFGLLSIQWVVFDEKSK